MHSAFLIGITACRCYWSRLLSNHSTICCLSSGIGVSCDSFRGALQCSQPSSIGTQSQAAGVRQNAGPTWRRDLSGLTGGGE